MHINDKIDIYEKLIKENIAYADLTQSRKYDIGLINEFISIILDVMLSKGEYIRIGGEDKPRALVQSVLMKLNYHDIEHCIDQFKNHGEPIVKKKQYITTMLYNSKHESDAHYTNAYSVDKYGG